MEKFNSIIEPTFSDKAIVAGLFLVSIIIMIFFIYGVFAVCWSVPEKRVEIKHLQNRVGVWQARSVELEKAVEDYQVAMKFENLFLLAADSNQVMDFEALDQYIKDRKDFYKAKK